MPSDLIYPYVRHSFASSVNPGIGFIPKCTSCHYTPWHSNWPKVAILLFIRIGAMRDSLKWTRRTFSV